MIANAGETTALMMELGRQFAVEDDQARLALAHLEADGAGLDWSDGMLAHCGTVRPRCECIGRRGEDGAYESQMPLPFRDLLLGRGFSV